VRRVRVGGVAADFLVPPKWPTPTDRWIRNNTFWEPPPGWTPLGGLPPAPVGWVFWKPNPQFLRRRIATDAALALWARLSNLLFLFWVALAALHVVVTVMELPRPPALGFLLSGALIASLGCTIVRESLRTRLIRRTAQQAAVAAADERQRRLVREYQRYLADPA